MKRSRTVFETRSSLLGRIRVIDQGAERRLMVSGETLSVYPLNGDWSRVRREYWWRAVAAVDLPPTPTVLLLGLGGGTQVHVLEQVRRPRQLTIIERDPTILRIAQRWFGLPARGGIEFLCGDAEVIAPWLARAQRRFDFVMEDVGYAEDVARSLPLARVLARLVSPRGVLVINRHRRGDAHRLADALRALFAEVWLRRVRREAENVLVCCARPRRSDASGSPSGLAGQRTRRRL